MTGEWMLVVQQFQVHENSQSEPIQEYCQVMEEENEHGVACYNVHSG